MDIRNAFPSKYLKASDLQGREVNVIINRVVDSEEVGQDQHKLLFISKTRRRDSFSTKLTRISFSNSTVMKPMIGAVKTLYFILRSWISAGRRPTPSECAGQRAEAARTRRHRRA